MRAALGLLMATFNRLDVALVILSGGWTPLRRIIPTGALPRLDKGVSLPLVSRYESSGFHAA